MKLLDRQQKQVQETEALIKNLQDSSLNDGGNNNQILSNSANITETNTPSITASLLSGFDYGFVSRSEGCRFENVNDFNE